MSIRAMAHVWETSQTKGSELLLLLAIADHAHDDGTGAYPSVELLARKSRQSVRNVQYLIRRVERLGELKVERRGGPNCVNLYTIQLPKTGVVQTLHGANQRRDGANRRIKVVQGVAPKPSGTVKEPSLVATTQFRWSIADGWEGFSDQLRKEWRKAFPACDIERQLAEMNIWLRANPAKAHKKNWLRFASGWLQRNQERGGDLRSTRKQPDPNPLDEDPSKWKPKY